VAFSPPPTDEQLLLAVSVAQEHGYTLSAARKAGVTSSSTLRNRVELAAKRGLLGFSPVLPGFQISKTTTVTNEAGDVVREFIQQKPDLGETFEVPAGHTVKGVSALVDCDGRTIQQWIKTKEQTQTDLIAAIKEEFGQYSGHGQARQASERKH
jgi:hypothetical protein